MPSLEQCEKNNPPHTQLALRRRKKYKRRGEERDKLDSGRFSKGNQVEKKKMNEGRAKKTYGTGLKSPEKTILEEPIYLMLRTENT